MSIILPSISWLALGVPSSFVFFRRGRWEVGMATLPFAGGLSLLFPFIMVPIIGSAISGWVWQAILSSFILAIAIEMLFSKNEIFSTDTLVGINKIVAVISFSVVVIFSVANIKIGFVLAEGWPGYEWDGFAIWLLRAKVLAYSHEFPAMFFAEPLIADSHWDYPLFLPVFLAWFLKVGNLNLHELSIPLGLLAGIIPLATFLGLYKKVYSPFAGAISIAPLAADKLLKYHYGAYADPLFVITAISGFSWVMVGIRHNDTILIIAGGLALGVATATKNEGALWFFSVFIAVLISILSINKDVDRLLISLLRMSFVSFIFFLGWQIASGKLGVNNDLVQNMRFDLILDRYETVFKAFYKHLWKFENLVLLFLCFVAIACFSPGSWFFRLTRMSALLAAPLVYLSGIFIIYLTTPHDLSWHIATSMDRTLLIITPAIFVAAVCAIMPSINDASSSHKNLSELQL